MFSRIKIILEDNDITLHMMTYMNFFLYNMKIAMRIFRTLVQFGHMYDVYTNDSLHGMFLTVCMTLHVPPGVATHHFCQVIAFASS